MPHYHLNLADAVAHLVTVQYTFTPPASGRTHVMMPAWCPGSYLIRDYARLVRDLTVTDAEGRDLRATKVDKHTWEFDAPASAVTVRYQVYGHELTVRTNHIDETHAFLHGPATFVYCPAVADQAVEISLNAPDGWRVVSGMAFGAPAAAAVGTLRAAHMDALFDMPLHIGEAQRVPVPARVPVELVLWGQALPGPITLEGLRTDVGAIVDDHIARFGEAPFEHYTFVVMQAHEAYGGLEHANSSINLFGPNWTTARKPYEQLLELLSHEFFHAWNGKRIAPAALLRFDYGREAYTRCLWVMEGITSHYDRYALLSAKRITDKSFWDKFLDDWTRLLAVPGRAKQSLEASSFDAWIKLYKPDESNLNTTVSYYLKGGLAIGLLDLQIRRRTEGRKSFDDILRALWHEFGQPGRPHPEDLQAVFEAAVGLDLQLWFDEVVRGTVDPDATTELAYLGLALRTSVDAAGYADGGQPGWLGVQCSGNRVSAVFDASPAQHAGVSPGDEIIAVDGYRCTSEADVRTQCAAHGAGAQILLSVFRRHRLLTVPVALAPLPPGKYEIASGAEVSEATSANYHAWLGTALLASQTLATVTTTNRSV